MLFVWYGKNVMITIWPLEAGFPAAAAASGAKMRQGHWPLSRFTVLVESRAG